MRGHGAVVRGGRGAVVAARGGVLLLLDWRAGGAVDHVAAQELLVVLLGVPQPLVPRVQPRGPAGGGGGVVLHLPDRVEQPVVPGSRSRRSMSLRHRRGCGGGPMGRRLLPDVGVRLIDRQPPVSLTLVVMGGGRVPVPLLQPRGPQGHWRGRDLVPWRGPGVWRCALARSGCGRADRLLVLGQPGGVNGPRGHCCRRRRYSSH